MAKGYFQVRPDVLLTVLRKLKAKFKKKAVRFKRNMMSIHKALSQYVDDRTEFIVLPGNLFSKALGYINAHESFSFKYHKIQQAA